MNLKNTMLSERSRAKSRILYHSIYMNYPEWENPQKVDYWALGAKWKEKWKVTAHQYGVPFWYETNVLELDNGHSSITL